MLPFPVVRINGDWLRVAGEGVVEDVYGNPIARFLDVEPSPWETIWGSLARPTKEKEMTTTLALPVLESVANNGDLFTEAVIGGSAGMATEAVILTEVPVELLNKQNMAQALATKIKVAARGVLSAVRRLANAIADKLHLHGLINAIKTAASWARGKLARGASLLGVPGGIGLGLTLVSTKTGRKVLTNTVGLVAKGAYKVVGWGYDGLTWGLRKVGLGWLSNKMDAGCAKVAGKAAGFYMKHVAKHVALGSNAMHAVKTLGFTMLALRAISFIPIPVLPSILTTLVVGYFLANMGGVLLDAGVMSDGPKPVTKKAVAPVGEFHSYAASSAANEAKMDEAKKARIAADAAARQARIVELEAKEAAVKAVNAADKAAWDKRMAELDAQYVAKAKQTSEAVEMAEKVAANKALGEATLAAEKVNEDMAKQALALNAAKAARVSPMPVGPSPSVDGLIPSSTPVPPLMTQEDVDYAIECNQAYNARIAAENATVPEVLEAITTLATAPAMPAMPLFSDTEKAEIAKAEAAVDAKVAQAKADLAVAMAAGKAAQELADREALVAAARAEDPAQAAVTLGEVEAPVEEAPRTALEVRDEALEAAKEADGLALEARKTAEAAKKVADAARKEARAAGLTYNREKKAAEQEAARQARELELLAVGPEAPVEVQKYPAKANAKKA